MMQKVKNNDKNLAQPQPYAKISTKKRQSIGSSEFKTNKMKTMSPS
jgi:hypothetical protein